MAKETIEKEIIISVNTNASQTTKAIEKVTEALREETQAEKEARIEKEKLAKAQKDLDKASQDLSSSLTKNSLLTEALDKVSGGYFSTISAGTESIKGLAQGVLTYTSATQKAEGVTKRATIATRAYNTALMATGIGAVIALLAFLAINLFKAKQNTELLTRAQNDLNLALERSSDLYEGYLGVLEHSYNIAVERAKQAGASEKELADLRTKYAKDRVDAIDDEIKKTDELIKNNQANAQQGIFDIEGYKELNKKRTDLGKERLRIERGENLQRERDTTSTLEKIKTKEEEAKKRFIENEAKKTEALKKELEAREKIEKEAFDRFIQVSSNFGVGPLAKIFEENLKLERARLKDLEENLKLEEFLRESANRKVNEYYDEQSLKLQDALKEYEKFQKDIENNGEGFYNKLFNTDSFISASESLELVKAEYKNLIEVDSESWSEIEDALDKRIKIFDKWTTDYYSISDSKTIKELEFTQDYLTSRLEMQFDADYKLLELSGATDEELLNMENGFQSKLTDLEKEGSDKRKLIKSKEVDYYLAMTDSISGILDGLSTASKEGSSIQKGLAIASVALDTGVAAISAFKGMVATFPGPQGTALGAIASAGIALQGLNQINQLKKIKTDGTETGGSATASATMTPNVQFVSSADNQISNTIAEVSPEDTGPIKAYVVSSEVTTSQQLERNAVESSSL